MGSFWWNLFASVIVYIIILMIVLFKIIIEKNGIFGTDIFTAGDAGSTGSTRR